MPCCFVGPILLRQSADSLARGEYHPNSNRIGDRVAYTYRHRSAADSIRACLAKAYSKKTNL